MSNKKVLSKATRGLNKTKRFAAPKNIIEDPRGQWAHPGEITRIPSDNITMQGVPYPVMAYPNMGEPQMMYPGGEYNFPGADYVDEYPQMKKGGLPKSLVKMPKLGKKGVDSKKFSRSLDATNKLFTEHYLFAKPKSKKRKVFDPNAQYQEGGTAASPMDLDPVHMKKYLADLKMQENANKKGYKNGMWYPHHSVEGGADTIAYGHKLTPNDAHLRKGITEEQATALQEQDVLRNQAQAKRQVDKKYGAGTFDSLPQDSQMLLVDYQYNLGSLSGFPSFVDATVKGNKDKMLAEHTRYGAGKPLTKRNNWTVDVINNMGTEEKFDPMQVTIPQANIPDATNVVQPIIFPGPDESIELELTPEEIKQYQMGGYIVEDVEGTNEAAMPCAPGYIFDPRIGKCVPENAYRLSRASVKDNINVDDAIKENRRYYEGYQFMKDWQNSPMYNKMLKGAAKNTKSYEYLRKMRQKQLDSTPPLQILPQPEGQESTAGQSWSNTGQIEIFPAGFGTRGTASHELSHSADRPVEGTDLRLIPQRDVEYINNNKAKTIGDSRSYHNYKDNYDYWFKEDPEYKEQVDDNFKSFYSNYVGEPTEVRARLNEIRQTAKEAGLYDPFTESVSPDLYYKKLKNYKFEKGDKSGFDGMKQLQDAFSDEEIIWLLNNMSKTEDNKEELDLAQDGGAPNPKTSFYTVEGSGGVYRKVNGRWEVDWNRSGKFQPLSQGDVKKRAAVLDKKAKPLYDATYDDLYATQRSAYTAAPKPAPTKKPTVQDKAAQEQFNKSFAVTGKSKMEVIEDKIQKNADDYAKYHQDKYGEPLSQEDYDAAYQDIYNRAYVDAGMYNPNMSGSVSNPYGTTQERKNLISLDPGKAPKNLTLGDYVDKGWDVITNPLDYASYALKPKGTVTTPWNMTNYENRLEAAGLEDPVTANNNVNKAIDFASWFTPAGMVAQGLKMIPGTVNSIGRAFENPSWENAGDALFDVGMTALSVAPGFGMAKNLGKGAATVDDLKAIEALRGNTTTTPFQSYYLTGNRALGTSEAAAQQSQALRKFIEPQSLQLQAGKSPIMSEGTRSQLTNTGVDSYFPVRFGDEPYAAAGNEFYQIDPEDYNILNEATQKLETDPNWRQEGLKDAYSSLNSSSNKARGYSADLFKDINYEFKDFSPGWQVGQDAKNLLMPAQRMPKKSDYFTDSEFYDMLSQEMNYNILDDERKIQEFRAGKKFTDEEFAQMNPGVTRPDFTTKMLTDEHRKVVNELLSDNPSVKSNPLLKENLQAAISRSERRENALPISSTIRQDLEKYPSETLINLYGDQYAGVSPEQIASLSPEQLEQTKQTIIDNIANAMTKSEEEFARENPFRSGDTSMSLNRTTDILPKGKSKSKDPLNKLAGLVRRRKSKSELSALDDLETIRKQSRTGQENAANLLNNEIEQKLKDLDTPEGRRRVQKYIKDNNLSIEEYDPGNYDELTKTIDSELPGILSNKYSDESRRIVDLVRNNMIAKKRSPQLMANIKSWNELEPEHILKSPLLNRIAVTDIIVPADPRFTGGIKQRPFTYDEYIESVQNVVYEDIAVQIQEQQALIKRVEDNIRKLVVEKNIVNGGFGSAKTPNRGEVQKIMADYNRKILDEHTKIAMINKNISSLTDRLQRNNANFDKDMFYNNELTNVISLGEPFTAMGDVLPTMTHEIGHHTETIGLGRGKNSAIDRDLIANLDFAKKAPQYLYKKLDPDKVRETAPYHTNFEGIDKYRDPKDYFKRNLDYFKEGNTGEVGKSSEPSAFVVEMRPALKELGFIEGNFDIVTPEMIEQLYNEYITNPTFEFRDLRIFDIIEPSKKSFKQLAKSYNDIKSLLPYAVPVGIGVGATSVGGQEEMQDDMGYQDGGIIMELSDDEIQQYANGGFVVEELEYRPDAGKAINKKETSIPKAVTVPKITINTEGLSYRPDVSSKPKNPNPRTTVKPQQQPKVQQPKIQKPEVVVDSMANILNKYAIGDTSPIMTTDAFQNIFAKQEQEKQAKVEKLRKQIEASQNQIKKQGTPSYKYPEEIVEGMPNIRTTESASYQQGSSLKNEVKKVVLHHTGTTDEKNNNKYVHNHFMNPKSETSSHIVIEEDGLRTIYASPDQVTFHAGKSSWDGRSNVNDFGVGVEFQGDTNLKPLTNAQIESFVEYFDQLAKQYKISTKDIITHAMVAPGRKPDITESEYKRILKYLKEKGYK